MTRETTINDGASDLAMIPASFAQQRIWFLDQLGPQSTAYNDPTSLRLNIALNVGALEQSFNAFVQRHEVLRTSFVAVNGHPMQVIAPALKLPLPLVDLSTLLHAEREAEALRLANEQAQRPFDLTQGPLMRVLLLQLGAEEYLLLLTIHQIISDGWSLGVLFQELASLYTAFTSGQPSSLPDLPIQYADYALWQQERVQEDLLADDLAYWKQQLAGAPALLDLPTDRPYPASQTFRGSAYLVTLPLDLTEALKTLSRREGVTLYMTLVAAFQTLLYRYTGQDDMVLGTFTAGRTHEELEALIGFFVNTLVLRTDLSGNPTFRELLGRVRTVTFEAYAHQEVPFDSLVRELQPTRSLGQNPLCQVMLVLQPPPPPLPSGWELSRMDIKTGAARFDLSLNSADRPEGLACSFEYSTALFDATTIARMAGHWQTLLEGIVAEPTRQLAELSLLTENERQQLLVEWNATHAGYPKDRCIHQLFEAQVERTPDAVAVVFEDEPMTYRELNRRANQLAHHLRALGVGPEMLVGLCVERSLEMVIGLLGILKAGGAYVPLDPAYPKERLAFMLEDSQAVVLLTCEQLLPLLPEHQPHTVCLDSAWPTIAQELTVNPVTPSTSDNLAYVIYTSGSTGKPKGVSVSHQNLVHSTVARTIYYKEPVNRFLLLSSFAFDSSVAGIFWTLCQGGALVLPRADLQLEISYLTKLIPQNQVSHLLCLPALYMLLLEQAKLQQIVSLRTIIVAGEPCPKELIKRHYHLLSHAQLFNEYGPTEGTVWCSVYNCRPENLRSPVPIGRPIPNMQVYLLDTHLQLVPIGVPGELHIGGDGLARGYLNHPELTNAKFIAHPFSNEPGARLYRTGDLARYLPDGNIEFLGRADHQVKIRGFRIELGEIEEVLRQHPQVQEAVVAARGDTSGDKRLVAYIVAAQRQSLPINDLRVSLKEKLPDYMLPSAFVLLDALPLTPNGKIDRQALPMLDQVKPQLEETFVAPRSSVEEVLASVWAEVLGLEQIGIYDNFFALGGHSLLAMQVTWRLWTTMQVEVPLRAFFEASTVAQLAEIIPRLQAQRAMSQMPALGAFSREAYRVVSPEQKRS